MKKYKNKTITLSELKILFKDSKRNFGLLDKGLCVNEDNKGEGSEQEVYRRNVHFNEKY